MPETNRQNPYSGGFSPEMRLLTTSVACALGLPKETDRDLKAVNLNAVDWDLFCEMAHSHRVLALAYSGLQVASDIDVPSDVTARLAREAMQSWRRSLILTRELAQLSGLLHSQGIAMVALKGPALAVQVYRLSSLRAMRDLDVLIRAADFPQTKAVMEANGFVCEEPIRRLTPEQQTQYQRSATHISFRSVALGYLVEVHLRPLQVPALFPVSTDSLMKQAQNVRLGEHDVSTLSLRHHFLYVAAHGAKHGWWRLLWLADFAAFQIRWPGWVSELESADGLGRVLTAAAWLSSTCFGSPLPVWATEKKKEKRVYAIAVHGNQCLERGRPPSTYLEKWAELANLLRLRSELRYYGEVFALYWSLTPADLSCVTLPILPARLYPALRPFLWICRRWFQMGPSSTSAEDK